MRTLFSALARMLPTRSRSESTPQNLEVLARHFAHHMAQFDANYRDAMQNVTAIDDQLYVSAWDGLPQHLSGYSPPRNAVLELLLTVSPEVRAVVQQEISAVEDCLPTGVWPHDPYHYGMGQIDAYERWLASLSPDDHEQETEKCRTRFENHYREQADLLISRMRAKGFDISQPFAPEFIAAVRKPLNRWVFCGKRRNTAEYRQLIMATDAAVPAVLDQLELPSHSSFAPAFREMISREIDRANAGPSRRIMTSLVARQNASRRSP